MADDNGVGGFGWFLAGLGIGALVGVLYAPKSGKETREELVARSLDARDKANELYNQGVEQATQYVQQGKQVATQYVQQGKEAATQYVDKGKDLIQTQAEAVQAAVDAGKDAYVKTATSGEPNS